MVVLDKIEPGKSYATIEGGRALRNDGRSSRDTVSTAAPRPDLADLERAALESALEARGHQRFHARQVFRWIHKHGVTDIDAMTDLSRDLRAALSRDFLLTTPVLAQREKSLDGTEKFLLRLADGKHLESVFIPDTPAMTFCISTQVGCAMACAFCLTGKMGLVRNLSAGEIVGQVRVLAGTLDLRDKKFNIVLMGMGNRFTTTTRRCGRCECLPTSTDSGCRRAGSRCPPSDCCRRWNGSPGSR